MAQPPIDPPSADAVRYAILHLIAVAAARHPEEVARDGKTTGTRADDPDAERLLVAVVEAVKRHRARAEKAGLQGLVRGVQEALQAVYERDAAARAKEQRQNPRRPRRKIIGRTQEESEDDIRDTFRERALPVPEGRLLADLVYDPAKDVTPRGTKDPSVERAARMFRIATRTLYNWGAVSSETLLPTAYGRGVGRVAILKYAARALGVPDQQIEAAIDAMNDAAARRGRE